MRSGRLPRGPDMDNIRLEARFCPYFFNISAFLRHYAVILPQIWTNSHVFPRAAHNRGYGITVLRLIQPPIRHFPPTWKKVWTKPRRSRDIVHEMRSFYGQISFFRLEMSISRYRGRISFRGTAVQWRLTGSSRMEIPRRGGHMRITRSSGIIEKKAGPGRFGRR